MNEHFDKHQKPSKNSPPHSPVSPPRKPRITDSIAVYTQLSILLKMRQELGLEAMLEYLDAYIRIIEQNNPELKRAVEKALALVSVRRMYRQAFPK